MFKKNCNFLLRFFLGKEAEELITELSTAGVHHKKTSVIQLRQNLFFGSRTNRINAQYFCLLRNPSDALQVFNLQRQLCPSHKNFLLESFADATKQLYGYLIINVHPASSDPNLFLVTGIFPQENTFVYLPKKRKNYALK